MELAKTANRSVRGCMNELAWYGEVAIGCRDTRFLDVARLNHELRRVITRAAPRLVPIELATAQAATRG